MTLCPQIKACQEYRTKRRYSFVEKKQCGWKEYWSKCPLITSHEDVETCGGSESTAWMSLPKLVRRRKKD